MNWDLLLPLLVTALVAFIGWLVTHLSESRRAREFKRREIRTSYLIEAWRRLESICHRPQLARDQVSKLEGALADIQLFGTNRQIDLAGSLIEAYAKNGNVDITDLLKDLRNDLRGELELEPLPPPLVFMRVTWDEDSKEA